ncbi:MAG TPA: UDP-N-acetylmuramate dehydrogenase [Chitinophagaceae bacterium]|nr:UDP-N-acetylmuramate dehydrogenase [Chitinophagaceae bacterium]
MAFIRENISLQPYHTFGIDVPARYFSSFRGISELQELVTESLHLPASPNQSLRAPFILGGGSNILFLSNVDGLVLKNEVMGIEKGEEDEDHIYISVGAGENWHGFVLHCIANGWAGIENLSLIPGNVGASPMQNIGAYGVELSSVFHELKAFHLREQSNYTFSKKDCAFGYRDSIFKRKYRDQFVIMRVTFRLNKKPVFHTEYGVIREELERMGVQELSIAAISQAVINIRQSKLPDPAEIGNAGSFFKNPVVNKNVFEKLKQRFEYIVGHEQTDGSMKLAAAWLIEHCGPREGESWKGFRRGDAGCHARQALVLVNYGQATGKEIFDLSEEIRISVKEKFDVDLEREVNCL